MAKYKKVSNALDPNFRNDYNNNVDAIEADMEKSLSDSSEALNIANQAQFQSQSAEDKANSVKAEFNQVVIEGDSSVEAAQARVDADGVTHTTLKERLDANETETANEIDQIQNDVNGLNVGVNEINESTIPQIQNDITNLNSQIEKESEFSKPFPWYVAHRGARNIYQEHTIKAYENCIARGNKLIELDVRKNADGALVVMHDDTLDRTTDGKWNVNLVSTGYLSTRSVDDKVTTGEYGYTNQPIPTLNQVFERLGRKTNYIIESKDRESAQDICALVKKMKLEDFVIIQSFSSSDLRTIKDEGIRLMYLSDLVQPLAVNLFLLDNIHYLGCSVNAPDSYITSMMNEGFKVFVYTVNHKFQHERLQALGVHGYFSDEPFYIQNNYQLSTDRFREKVFTDGMLACDGEYRGTFNTQTLSPYTWGFTDNTTKVNERDFVLQGYLGELDESFTLNYQIQFENIATGWLSTAICLGKDYFDDTNYAKSAGGYHLLFSEIGHLFIYKITDTEAVKIAEYRTNQPVAANTPIDLKVTVNTTSIKFERLDVPYSVTAVDNSKRSGYVAFGRRMVRGSFSNVSVS
ncbi:glycerophosphodiester phosphodiesterase [Pseudalkalibacillus sp. JSM 102089]|uniref:glycerophosphodiester phosphodiesterase n=1 Tax=Pseudalkalibacillus sp. JSM 102089 TaxID=3229856 RepID=UPI003524426A